MAAQIGGTSGIGQSDAQRELPERGPLRNLRNSAQTSLEAASGLNPDTVSRSWQKKCEEQGVAESQVSVGNALGIQQDLSILNNPSAFTSQPQPLTAAEAAVEPARPRHELQDLSLLNNPEAFESDGPSLVAAEIDDWRKDLSLFNNAEAFYPHGGALVADEAQEPLESALEANEVHDRQGQFCQELSLLTNPEAFGEVDASENFQHTAHQADAKLDIDEEAAQGNDFVEAVPSLGSEAASISTSVGLASLSQLRGRLGLSSWRTTKKDLSDFERHMKALKVVGAYRFLVDGASHEVRILHKNSVWELLLDDAVVGVLTHDSDRVLTAEKHVLDFGIPRVSSPEVVMACARMTWLPAKLRWSYRLYVNNIDVPACYKVFLGEITDVTPPEVGKKEVAGKG